MAATHALASGMGGMRAAGDLVARMEMGRGMRLTEAKAYVAEKLGVSPFDLSDPAAMHERRGELGLGRFFEAESPQPFDVGPMEAKANIGELLEIRINPRAQRAKRRPLTRRRGSV
jgi:dimethylamine--corrinoid protein Co-methyltransferase